LDHLHCKGVELSEKKGKKLRMGQVAFPLQLLQSSQKINAWTLLEKKRGTKTSSHLIRRTLQKASINSDARGYSREAITEHLKLANQDYYSIKGSAKELRDTTLENLAAEMAQIGNTSKEKMLQVLHHREKHRATARKIRVLRRKLRTGSTTMVTIQNENGEQQGIPGKMEIEAAIMANNLAK
jgi:hypothetical protein